MKRPPRGTRNRKDRRSSAAKRTLSTSLAVPARIKQDLAREFGEGTALQRSALGFYRKVMAFVFKELCRDANGRCKEHAPAVFDHFLRGRENGTLVNDPKTGYGLLRKVTGSSEKLMESVHYMLFNTCKQALTLADKLADFGALLANPDFEHVLPSFLLYGYTVPHAVRYLAEQWGVTRKWTRALLRGWRHKLDGEFPARFQAEGLAGMTARLRAAFQEGLESAGGDTRKVLGKLQKHHLMHLLAQPGASLEPLFERSLHGELDRLHGVLSRVHGVRDLAGEFYGGETAVTGGEFRIAADRELARADGVIELLESRQRDIKKMRAFRSALQLLIDNITIIEPFLGVILPSSPQLHGLAAVISQHLPGRKRKVTGALGAVLARALATKYKVAAATVTARTIPSLILTVPFTSGKRKRVEVPLELVMNKEFLVYREASYVELGDILREKIRKWREGGGGSPRPSMTLWLPKKSVKDAWEQVFGGLNGATGERLKESASYNSLFDSKLEMEAVLTDPMIRSLERGAAVNGCRLNPPRGATGKVVANLTFSGEERCFEPRLAFVDRVHEEKAGVNALPWRDLSRHIFPPLPAKVIGNDRNQPGMHVIEFGTRKRVLDTGGEMSQAHKVSKKLVKVRKEIASLMKAITGTIKKLFKVKHPRKIGLLEAMHGRQLVELTNLHRRKAHLKRALDAECAMGGARVLLNHRAMFLASEALELSPRGTRGALARAITDMPKREEVVARMVKYASEYHGRYNAGARVTGIQLLHVDPRGTSSYCAACGTKLKKVSGEYHVQWCPSCEKEVPRHGNSAVNVAKRGHEMLVKATGHPRAIDLIKLLGIYQSFNEKVAGSPDRTWLPPPPGGGQGPNPGIS